MPHVPINRGMSILIDECDLPLVTSRRWTAKANSKAKRRFYAQANIGGRSAYLHRLIVDAQDGEVVDHINGDSLDNRRCNLRVVDHRINTINRGKIANALGLQGVHADGRRYRAKVERDGKRTHTPRYSNIYEAAFAYDRLAYRIHGPEARLNFPCARAALIGEAA